MSFTLLLVPSLLVVLSLLCQLYEVVFSTRFLFQCSLTLVTDHYQSALLLVFGDTGTYNMVFVKKYLMFSVSFSPCAIFVSYISSPLRSRLALLRGKSGRIGLDSFKWIEIQSEMRVYI